MFGGLLKKAARGVVKATKFAGPVAAGFAAGGPAGAALALTAQVAGGSAKVAGKVNVAGGGKPVHKAAAPVAAVAAPTLLAAVLSHAGVAGADGIAGIVCGSPEATGAIYGALAVLIHQVTHGTEAAIES